MLDKKLNLKTFLCINPVSYFLAIIGDRKEEIFMTKRSSLQPEKIPLLQYVPIPDVQVKWTAFTQHLQTGPVLLYPVMLQGLANICQVKITIHCTDQTRNWTQLVISPFVQTVHHLKEVHLGHLGGCRFLPMTSKASE